VADNFLAELIKITLKVKALFTRSKLYSYESKYKTIFPYNHLFQTVSVRFSRRPDADCPEKIRDAGTGGGGGQEGKLPLLPFARGGKGGRSAL
jgi:hypothetical protein